MEVRVSWCCSLAFTQTHTMQFSKQHVSQALAETARRAPGDLVSGGLWRVKLVWGPAAAACVALMNRTWCRPLIFCPARGWSLTLNGGPLLYKELRFPTIVRAAAPAARERGQGGKHRCRPDTTRCQRHETVMQIAGPFVCVCTGVCMFTDGGCTPPDHLN